MELEVPPPEQTEQVLGPVRDRAAAGPPDELDVLDRQFWYACVGAVCDRLGDHDSAVRHFGAGLKELGEDSDDWADTACPNSTRRPDPQPHGPSKHSPTGGAFTYTGHAGRDVYAGRPHSASTPADPTGDHR